MIAETRAGNGDAALDYYLRTNPSAREEISDVHRCEPYVYAQMIAGRDAPTCGEAKNSWLTGAAAWNLVAVTQWILGIRPEHDGLRVDPCLPATGRASPPSAISGERPSASRFASNAGRGRVSSLVVDGERIEGNVVPTQPAGRVVDVIAEIVDASGEVRAVEMQVETASTPAP